MNMMSFMYDAECGLPLPGEIGAPGSKAITYCNLLYGIMLNSSIILSIRMWRIIENCFRTKPRKRDKTKCSLKARKRIFLSQRHKTCGCTMTLDRKYYLRNSQKNYCYIFNKRKSIASAVKRSNFLNTTTSIIYQYCVRLYLLWNSIKE